MRILPAIMSIMVVMSCDDARPTTSSRERLLVGANIHIGQNKINAAQAKVFSKLAGINTARVELYWHRLEVGSNGFALPPSLYDAASYIRWLNSEGGSAIVVLGYGNPQLKIEQPKNEYERNAFGRYVEFVSKEFKGKVSLYELWNEWNIGAGKTDRTRTGNPDDYVALAEVTKTILNRTDRDAKLICGSIADLNIRWLRTAIEKGLLKHCDGISLHPYVFGLGTKGTPEKLFDWVDEVHALAERYVTGTPIYLTETGWPVSSNAEGVSEAVAAKHISKLLLLAWSRPWIRGVWLYELQDSGSDPENREHRFGLVTQDGSARPAFKALVDVNASILKSTTIEFQEDNHQYFFGAKTLKGGCNAIAWQTSLSEKSVAFPKLCNSRYVNGLQPTLDNREGALTPILFESPETCSFILKNCIEINPEK